MWLRWKLAALCAVPAVLLVLRAQDYAPPPVVTPSEAALKEIAERSDRLDRKLASVRRQGVNDALRVDAEIYLKAAQWIRRHNEFYDKDSAAWTLDALDRGLLRASQLAQGETPWLQEMGHAVVRAYRSRIDNSVQPFAVTFPADYGKDFARKWRVDVVLHGRDTSLTEVKFLHQHDGDKPAPKEQDFIQIDIFGRGNNAYRWAGETDVNEAIDAFLAAERAVGRAMLIDPQRFVLRGFSMGGAGTWHLGLHQPARWAVIGPGAGFTTTRGYWDGLPEKLPPAVEACLHIYDAVDYADNAFNVPIVAYAGDKDKQAQAAKNIEAKIKPLGISMTLLLAPGLEHVFPAEWRKKAEEEYAKHVAKGRPEYPPHVRFVTYTLKYPQCAWMNLLSLERHYQKAAVDADQTESGYTIKTTNVRAIHVDVPSGVRNVMKLDIDGQLLEARPYLSVDSTLHFYLEKRANKWAVVLPERLVTDRQRHPQKMPTLQGPIDDAFTSNFLCVRGTGKAWNAAAQQFADDELKRFAADWDKFFRGEPPVKDDADVTPEDIAASHLILFGDPGSNSLIAQTLDALPLAWDKETIKLGGHSVKSADHVPALIYPNPLNLTKYVVLNSGHTFRAADFLGTNARLFPRLGDYALLKPAPTKDDPVATEVVTVGLFDDFWQAPRP
ncbi:MAG TPA: prolyl oligopeptidase family serine peptidase [Gemmataceae bacterium]